MNHNERNNGPSSKNDTTKSATSGQKSAGNEAGTSPNRGGEGKSGQSESSGKGKDAGSNNKEGSGGKSASEKSRNDASNKR